MVGNSIAQPGQVEGLTIERAVEYIDHLDSAITHRETPNEQIARIQLESRGYCTGDRRAVELHYAQDIGGYHLMAMAVSEAAGMEETAVHHRAEAEETYPYMFHYDEHHYGDEPRRLFYYTENCISVRSSGDREIRTIALLHFANQMDSKDALVALSGLVWDGSGRAMDPALARAEEMIDSIDPEDVETARFIFRRLKFLWAAAETRGQPEQVERTRTVVESLRTKLATHFM